MALAWAIGDRLTLRGFELAGFRGTPAESAEEVRAALAAAREAGATLVVVTERAARHAGGVDALEEGAGQDLRSLLVVLPSVAGPRLEPTPGEALRRTVRRALGIPGEARAPEADR